MLTPKYFQQILSWQPPAEADLHDYISSLYAKYEKFQNLTSQNFGSNGLIILLMFFLFLLLIIIIYIKSTLETFRSGQAEIEQPDLETNGLFYTLETPKITLANDNEPFAQTPPDASDPRQNTMPNISTAENTFNTSTKKDSELQKERELSADLIRASQKTADYLNLEHEYEALKQKMQHHAQAEHYRISAVTATDTAQEKPTAETNLKGLIAIIINMLGRSVSEHKIAQAVFNHYKSLLSASDVLQIIHTVRDFIGLCNAGKFDFLPHRETLPPVPEAVLKLAQGDSAPCLFLLQGLLNDLMNQAENQDGIVRDLTYAMAANCACLIGNIARLNDIELAHDSFELATELSPKNVTAWLRLGDLFMAEKAQEKAMIAYQNVIEIGDRIMYAEQIAAAQKHLAEYFLKQGLENKAEQFKRESERFYASCGIEAPLTVSENLVYNTFSENSAAYLPSAIKTLLMPRQ